MSDTTLYMSDAVEDASGTTLYMSNAVEDASADPQDVSNGLMLRLPTRKTRPMPWKTRLLTRKICPMKV